ncbi:Rha family transcriptional regulator [Bacillus wiedmannii]|uniref:Transcriptional regulator n=1 Tax=Bacillus wiedmannii TaxID=1890302 RepID=A0A2A8BSQ8_9BACI|nr:Rha family transcriptional regulator [Bacillus wiedmannii]PEM57619.1 transcriptional regulator [Bacillus wiedmannii]
MKELVFVNNNNEVVTDSLMVAEVFGKRHDNVMRDITNIIEEMHAVNDKEGVLNFEETPYQNEQNHQWYPKFNLTKDGFVHLIMGFTGKEARKFKTEYIKEFNRMEERIKNQQKPQSALDQLQQLLLEGSVELKERVEVIEEKLESRMTIDYQQQRMIQNLVEGRVRYLWNNGTPMGRFTKRQLFMKAYRRLKDRYGTSSYKDILVKDFEDATTYIQGWKGE